ncbi:MAG: hypothetical protein AAGF12_00925 [Myxococcota bacterium]
MFRCASCGEVSKVGAKSAERVVETRARTYPERTYRLRGDRKDRRDPGGNGTEIVRCIRVCRACEGH